MILALKILFLLITGVSFMGVIAEPKNEQKVIFAAITIAGIAGCLSAFILL